MRQVADWIEVLRGECGRTSQIAVAERLKC
jgi:hypothetical protein